MITLIFGYGSLVNDESRTRTAPHSTVVDRNAILQGYRRKTNAFYGDYVYMNIIPEKGNSVTGMIAAVDDEELEDLKHREREYATTDITTSLDKDYNQPVYTFIAPDIDYPDKQVLQTYLDTCTVGMDDAQKEQWIKDTIIPYGIHDDTENCVYKNVAE